LKELKKGGIHNGHPTRRQYIPPLFIYVMRAAIETYGKLDKEWKKAKLQILSKPKRKTHQPTHKDLQRN